MRLAPVQPLPRPALAAGRRGLFFPTMSILLLTAVVAGFWETFFFRSATAGPLPSRHAMHGVAATAWFVLFAVQSLLVSAGRVRWHRRLGWVAIAVVVLLVVTSLQTLFGIVDSWRGLGRDVDAQRGLIGLIVWGDLGALVAFVALVGRGVWLRRDRESHRRFMLMGSFAILSPALVRVAALPVLDGMDAILLTMGGLLGFALLLVLYDLATLRRVHRATALGIPFFLVVHLAPAFAFPGTPLDDWLLSRIW